MPSVIPPPFRCRHFHLVDATRAGLTDFHESSVASSLGVAGAVALAAFAAATLLFARGWRLKP
jgi:hypothetical protein